MTKILFCCTHNRCRSRMAEAILQNMCPQWIVQSAGSSPSGDVDPNVRSILREIGLDADGPGRNVRDMPLSTYDLIVTLCADEDVCPILPPAVRKRTLHVPFDDPSRNNEALNYEQRMQCYRNVRNQLEQFCSSIKTRFDQ